MSDSNKFGYLPFKGGRGFLIPLTSKKVAVSGLEIINSPSIVTNLFKSLVRLGLQIGIVDPILKSSYRRLLTKDNLPNFDNLAEELYRVLKWKNLALAVSLGTSGPHRKPVIQVMDERGIVLSYIKVGWNKRTDCLLDNEIKALKFLERSSLCSIDFPKVLYGGEWEDKKIMVQTSPKGRWVPAPTQMTDKYLAPLKALAELNPRVLPVSQSQFWLRILQRIQNVENPDHLGILNKARVNLEESLHKRDLQFHFCHGDFMPWNMKMANDRLFVFDWEYASLESPAGWDLFHILVNTMFLIQKRKPDYIFRSIAENEKVRFWINGYLKPLNLDESFIIPLLVLYLLDRLSFYLVEDPSNLQNISMLKRMLSIINDRGQF